MSALEVVAGIIEDGEGRVLLAERPPGRALSGYWEFPGGKIEPGESPTAALERELFEELKIRANILYFLGSFQFDYATGPINLQVHIVTTQDEPRQTESVHVFKWVNPYAIEIAEMAPADVRPLRSYLSYLSSRPKPK